MSECHVCDDCQRKVDEYGREVNAQIARLKAELGAAKRENMTIRNTLSTIATEQSDRAEAAERRCADLERVVGAKDAALGEAWVAVCGSGCPSTWKTGTPRPHSLLCQQIKSALTPAPQIAGEAKPLPGSLDTDIEWVCQDRDRWQQACNENTVKLRFSMKRIELADKLIKASQAYDDFDCPHYAEDRCKCGKTQMQLKKEYHLARIEYENFVAAGPPAPAPSAAEGKPMDRHAADCPEEGERWPGDECPGCGYKPAASGEAGAE